VRALAVVIVACAVLVLAQTSEASTLSRPAVDRPQAGLLDPSLFADLSTGIALVRAFTCGGSLIDQGTGFLVGTSVIMTARHVVRRACREKVMIGGHWVAVALTTSWYTGGRGDMNAADVATLKLKNSVEGHVFVIRTSTAAQGANLAALGHPLGSDISLNQGTVVEKGRYFGVPMLAVRLLAAEGGSGSPLVDGKGNVVGILQIGLGGKDILGQRTSGVILGIDLPSWWPTARVSLCAYKYGGIPGCGGTPMSTPTPKPTCNLVPHGSCSDFDLSGRNFSGDNLEAMDLSYSDLSDANLSGADLSHANLEGADLTGADLTGVDLTLADLSGAQLDLSQFDDAFLCNTLLPDGVTHSGCGTGAISP
jgi:hypothetical protein